MVRKTICCPDTLCPAQKKISVGRLSGHDVEASCLEDLGRDHVGIHVRGWAAVLEVALSICLCGAWNAHRRPAVGHTVAELVDGRRLVGSSQAPLVASAVDLDVLEVLLLEVLDRLDDLGPPAIGAHLCSGI